MPIYEYRCTACGFQSEFLQKVSEPALSDCPECGKGSFSKMVTAAGFQLKGSGWYATDFKGGGSKGKSEGKSDAGSSESTSGDAAKSEGAKSEAPVCGAGACSACS